MYKLVGKLPILLLFPFILGYTCLSANRVNSYDFNNYQVVSADTGNIYDLQAFSEEVEIIKTHLAVVSEIKELLVENGVDISEINISLYLEELATDNSPPEKKQMSIEDSQVISSPWMELKLIQTENNSVETELELKIDAGYVRLMMDFFSRQDKAIVGKGFQEIPALEQTCFNEIEKAYSSNRLSGGREIFELVDAFSCAPKTIKKPLLSLFISAPQTDLFPMTESVYQRLNSCLDTAEEYYSELYPRLALRAFEILESESSFKPTWWTEIVEQVDSVQICPKKNY